MKRSSLGPDRVSGQRPSTADPSSIAMRSIGTASFPPDTIDTSSRNKPLTPLAVVNGSELCIVSQLNLFRSASRRLLSLSEVVFVPAMGGMLAAVIATGAFSGLPTDMTGTATPKMPVLASR